MGRALVEPWDEQLIRGAAPLTACAAASPFPEPRPAGFLEAAPWSGAGTAVLPFHQPSGTESVSLTAHQ